ncbi:beta-fructofuranosidase, insoluble isoenzyme CWINV3 isoform X3 [Beta vulgaris subsp. vulgaris]|uniref:beta-fructofuranosidase, insoluble isoenzyme CWINV3 isoform X3 n=1 Tax=Beta vulgaris subsp. vulgaris TaxID=3555 RepID=UPI0020367AA9|nr:beta-fructofuranosidase, insoluble isoenzyme CWINV3 isoform X3 [Beta vulgaris subsp. vulgaris]
MHTMEKPVVWALLLCFVAVVNGVQTTDLGQNGASAGTTQPYRTAYHFQPLKNWMNDPNGPLYYKGVYHLFYQYNPYSAIWGNMTWGHSISNDLVNWVHLEHALNPIEPYELGGCFSGSITMLPGGRPVIFYTGADTNNFQSQNLAFPKDPSDPLLREWVKSPHNPVITAEDDIEPSDFRDPTTAWQAVDGTWQVLIGGKIDGRGMAYLYQSNDFINWTRSEKIFHSSVKTGMWECPDFYPVSINGKDGVDNYLEKGNTKFVLKASFLDHDHYILGYYKAETDGFQVEATDFMEANTDWRYDYGGKFYASKTFFDGGKKRRILWAWIMEADSRANDIKKGWSGLQSIPRAVWLSASGNQLMQWPVEEIESLRKDEVEIQDKELKKGSLVEVVGITAAQADVEISFELPNLEDAEQMEPSWTDPQLLCAQKNAAVEGRLGPFGLLVLAFSNLTEETAIFFRVFKNHSRHIVLLCNDLSRSSLSRDVRKTTFGAFLDINPLQESISLRTLIDHSIVESFGGGGKACITARVYPVLAVDKEAKLFAFNKGSHNIKISKLNAWSMKEAKILPIMKRRKPPV